ncbi:hypothetical protein LCGC14_2328000 [marine sediment metagenome]|uniref:Uncharacterized protein n=1 Tax=marine sediment metagenome TaxID=412755 RepID=A0A0F9D382_9ZZZZ
MTEKIEKSLGRIEGKLDLIVPMVKDHDTRIQTVEKKVARNNGVLATLVVLWSGVVSFIKWG